MTRFQFLFGLALTVAITAAAGLVHGSLSGRWGGGVELDKAVTSLKGIPEQFGQWRLEKSEELTSTEIEQLAPYAYANRVYVNVATGQAVSVFVLLGPVGQTAVHNPEICYSSRNFTISDPKKPVTVRRVGSDADQFLAMKFRGKNLEGGELWTYYAWSPGDHWEATQEGRVGFAGYPYLYKIQLASYAQDVTGTENSDACRKFLDDFLPILQSRMIPAHRHWVWDWLSGLN